MKIYVGLILSSNNYGNFEVIELVSARKAKVKFLDTGNTADFTNENIRIGNIRDRSVTKWYCDWGINDADYSVTSGRKEGNESDKWICPYYQKWRNMVSRCYYKYRKDTYYKDCTVSEEWRRFSNFKKWVDEQPNRGWENCDLDKDILVEGNKVYSPDVCVFVDKLTNYFILSSKAIRGKHLLGVTYSKEGNTFLSRCCDPFKKESTHLGCFKTELEAHKAWQAKKHEYACQLADLQTDERASKVLRERYAPDKDWTTK